MALSWRAGRPVESDRCATIADGLAVRVAIPIAVEWLNACSRRDARGLGARDRLVPSSRSPMRASASSRPPQPRSPLSRTSRPTAPIVLVVTGRNIDDELLARCRQWDVSPSP